MSARHRKSDQTRRRAGVIGLAAMAVVAMVAYVAFTALSGLPLQSRYHVAVVLPDADHLIAADDVRSGGVRIGQVQAVDGAPATVREGVHAVLRLSLDPDVGRLPIDTTVRVRSASPLGATYLELTLGHARQVVPDGGTLRPLHPASTTNLVDLFDVFDHSTKRSFQRGVRELSDGLTGRGAALNGTFAGLSALLPPLTDVARLLSAPPARLERFIGVSAHLADALAPVSGELADLVSGGARTFGAVAGERAALGQAIDLAPSTEAAATSGLRRARPGLDRLAVLSSTLGPAVRRLPAALDTVDRTLRGGTPVLRSAPGIMRPLDASLAAITRVASVPSTDGAVRKLSGLFDASGQILDALVPAQTQCNLIPLFFQQFASYIGVIGVGNGPSMLNIAVDRGGATGDQIQSAAPAPNLHINYVPHENRNECEAGNEPFDGSQRLLASPPSTQAARTRESTPPPHVLDLARNAGLLDTGGTGR